MHGFYFLSSVITLSQNRLVTVPIWGAFWGVPRGKCSGKGIIYFGMIGAVPVLPGAVPVFCCCRGGRSYQGNRSEPCRAFLENLQQLPGAVAVVLLLFIFKTLGTDY